MRRRLELRTEVGHVILNEMGTGGQPELNVYELHLVFFIAPTVTQILEMEVAETKTDAHDWDVLLGRDVLSRAMFTMDFGGRFAVGLVR